MIFASILAIGLQGKASVTGMPTGGEVSVIGKLRPDQYTALRDYHSLPKIKTMPEAKRKIFTGTVIVLDFPNLGSMHVMNFRNGKRSVLDNPKQKNSENGVLLTKTLAGMSPKADIRFGGVEASGFDVKLPGEEKKLVGFQGTLVSYSHKKGQRAISILVRNGKIVSSEWAR